MSEIQTIELAERAAEGPAAEPKGGRFLFSSWHLVLIPIAVVMVIPLVWMVITSLQTLDQTRHYPPSLVPTSMQVRNYTDVLQQAPVTCLPLPPRFAPSPVPVPEEMNLTGRGEALKKGPSKD